MHSHLHSRIVKAIKVKNCDSMPPRVQLFFCSHQVVLKYSLGTAYKPATIYWYDTLQVKISKILAEIIG